MKSSSYSLGLKKFQIQQRRYIGNKYSLMPWIKRLVLKYTHGNSFFDIFAGSGSVTDYFINNYQTFYINDFLYSNNIIYKAFFGQSHINWPKLISYKNKFNKITKRKYDDKYFSNNFGGRYFSKHDASLIGEIRERIKLANDLTNRERDILISSLLYSADHISNTVGHYDAYRRRKNIPNRFKFNLIKPVNTKGKNIYIYRDDANRLVRIIHADIAFVDPPYNSRQYSRFYHVLGTITKWDKPKLYGVALKPKPQNMSEYCRIDAPTVFKDLITHLHVHYIITTYNNTYEEANSSSSRNKITHKQILNILNLVGKTKTFNRHYKYFNAGDTDFKHHQEFLFITKVNL